jgi:hypothetical protein
MGRYTSRRSRIVISSICHISFECRAATTTFQASVAKISIDLVSSALVSHRSLSLEFAVKSIHLSKKSFKIDSSVFDKAFFLTRFDIMFDNERSWIALLMAYIYKLYFDDFLERYLNFQIEIIISFWIS